MAKARKPRTVPDGLRTLGKAQRYLRRHRHHDPLSAAKMRSALAVTKGRGASHELFGPEPVYELEDPAIEEAIYPEDEPEDFAYSHADLMDRRGRP